MDMNAYKIESMSLRGIGTVHTGNHRIQVPGAIAGEKVKLDIVSDKYGRYYGKIKDFLEISDQRMKPHCNNFPSCPGCGLRHLSREFQSRRIVDLIRNITAKEFPDSVSKIPEPVFYGLQASEKYRTRCSLSLCFLDKRLVLGMKSQFPDEPPISLSNCPNHHPDLNDLIQTTENFFKECNLSKNTLQNIREIHFHLSTDGLHRILFVILDYEKNEAAFKKVLSTYFKSMELSLMCLTIKSNKSGISFKKPEILQGDRWISIKTQFAEFKALSGVWTPVAPESVNQLVESLQSDPWLNNCDNLLELGCGAGLTILPLAAKTITSIGVDKNRHAIESAIANAERLNISNSSFRTGDALHAIKKFAAQNKMVNCVIAHGMRKPFGPRLINMIQTLQNNTVILMSPSINAWFQDIHSGLERKWKLGQIKIFDQLPYTASYLLYGSLHKHE